MPATVQHISQRRLHCLSSRAADIALHVSLETPAVTIHQKGYLGTPAQGFTCTGARVGQSVSSNITSGVANSLLNRSFGLTAENQLAYSQSAARSSGRARSPSSAAAGTNIVSGGVVAPIDKKQKQRSTDESTGVVQSGKHPPTWVDAKIETFYAGFQKQRCNSKVRKVPIFWTVGNGRKKTIGRDGWGRKRKKFARRMWVAGWIMLFKSV